MFIICSRTRQVKLEDFQKGYKTFIENIQYLNQTYCIKISWIVYRMKIETTVFRILCRNFKLF